MTLRRFPDIDAAPALDALQAGDAIAVPLGERNVWHDPYVVVRPCCRKPYAMPSDKYTFVAMFVDERLRLGGQHREQAIVGGHNAGIHHRCPHCRVNWTIRFVHDDVGEVVGAEFVYGWVHDPRRRQPSKALPWVPAGQLHTVWTPPAGPGLRVVS